MNIFEAYNQTKKDLEQAGIEDYVFEAKQIIRHITGLSNKEILLKYNNSLTQFQKNNLTALIKQRKIRYPLQYIFGEWSFYGRDYYVGPGVLVPRADTETIIEKALEVYSKDSAPEILDLCTGSGCIGITLAKEIPDSKVYLVEKFSEAARYAEKNISRNEADNVQLIMGDIFEDIGADRQYDLIVSNPPYVTKDEMNTVSPETKYEPETALLAKDNGLEFYKAIAQKYKNSLKSGGMILFEVGKGQEDAVKDILKKENYASIGTKKDLNGIERAVFAFKQ